MEKIDLRVNEVGLGYQHLFIVYTDKDGQEFVIRGGPFEHILNPIDVEVGRYGSSSKDWVAPAERNSNDSITLLTGTDLEERFLKMAFQAQLIEAAKVDYQILSFLWSERELVVNSNTVVTSSLAAGGIIVTTDDLPPSVSSVNNVPGFNNHGLESNAVWSYFNKQVDASAVGFQDIYEGMLESFVDNNAGKLKDIFNPTGLVFNVPQAGISIDFLPRTAASYDDFYSRAASINPTIAPGDTSKINGNLQTFTFSGKEYILLEEEASIEYSAIGLWNDGGNVLQGGGGSYTIDPEATKSLGWIGGAQNHVSPLVLDLDGDGVAAELRHIYDDGAVFFDIDADGFAERVGWVGPNDGQLAMDWNGNGRIDDITELYGDDQMPAFSKLRLHDSNGDGQITAADADWSKLRVWQDLNQDGISQANELKTLAAHSIASISLNDTSDNRYIKENFISNVATFQLTTGVTREIADVHYLNDNVNTWALGAQSQVFGSTATINVDAMLLPQSRGYGSLPALHLAMTGDSELKALVKSLDRLAPTDLSQAGPLVDQILLRWAGVHDHDPDWRSPGGGNNIDSRKVDFLEEFGGITWAQRGTAPLVGVNASLGVKLSWQGVHSMMTARLLAQGPLEHVFGEVSYDFAQDKLLIADPLATILTRAAASASSLEPTEAQTFWATLGDTLVTLRASLGQTVAQINSAVMAKAGFDLFLGTKSLSEADGVLYSFGDDAPTTITEGVRIGNASANTIIGGSGEQVMFGGVGNDTIEGRSGDDFLRGDDGNDSLYGGDGFDRLEGGLGNDRLEGGNDRDILRGDAGTDTLLGGAGDDNLGGGAGADTLDGGTGADQVDYNDSSAAVTINLAAGTASGGDATGDVLISIEGVNGSQFNDLITGTSGNNVLNGEMGNDTIYGGAGNDVLFGATGDDQLYGQDGNDQFQAFDGAEVMDGGAGTDLVTYRHPFLTTGVYASLLAGKGYAGAATGDTYVGIEDLEGSDHNDILIGDNANNVLTAGLGANVLRGEGGNDSLVSSDGPDHLWGGTGADRFILARAGADGNRPSTANVKADVSAGSSEGIVGSTERLAIIADFDGVSGDRIDLSKQKMTSVVLQASGADTFIALGDGRSVLVLGKTPAQLASTDFILPSGVSAVTVGAAKSHASQTLRGSDADNAIRGGMGADTLLGLGGADVLVGESGMDRLDGSAGDDRLIGGRGADTLIGGTGFDTADYGESEAAVSVDLATGLGTGGAAQGDTLSTVEALRGSKLSDTLRGDAAANTVWGDSGNDLIVTAAGNDKLHGDEGDDNLQGGDGNDELTGGQGSDRLDGGTGVDLAQYHNETSLVVVDLTTAANNAGAAKGDVLVAVENVTGTFEGDTIRGDAAANTFYGLGGNDRLEGLAGSDQLIGEAGNDSLYGGDGDDFLLGGAGADRLDGAAGIDQIEYSTATAAVTVDLTTLANNTGEAAGDVYIGIERFVASSFNDILRGSTGADIFIGLAGNDRLEGLAGNDQLIGEAGNDLRYGGDGNDILRGGAGADRLDGGTGSDQADYINATAGLTLDLTTAANSTGDAAGDVLVAIENIGASNYNDTLRGNTGINIFFGLNGNDRLEGLAGNDQLYGEIGNDLLYGGDGNDFLQGGAGADRLDGGAGSDQADYGSATAGFTLDLTTAANSTGDAAGDVLVAVEIVSGSNLNDVLRGNAAANIFAGRNGNDRLEGLAGNDQLIGEIGNDSLYGGDGNDLLQGGAGADRLDGGLGSDQADYGSATAGFTLDLTTAANSTGEAAGDVLVAIEKVGASNFNDILRGNTGANILFGRNGNDRLEGLAGNDQLYGEIGNDSLYGGDGDDQLVGGDGVDLLDAGKGTDYLLGGTGNDTFVFFTGGGTDTVGDFTDGADKIRFGTAGIKFADLDMTQYTNGVMIDYGAAADGIFLESATLKVAQITATDFIFT